MINHQQAIALYTLVRREMVRMFRISSQAFLPPAITTGLYFLIFGSFIGKRIGTIEGIDYGLFIAPGLIIMSVITNAYSNVSSSLFTMRFQKSIEELLISPLHNALLLVGYVFGGMLRGLIVAILVFFVSCFFLKIRVENVFLSFFVVLLVAALFALAGFINGMLAKNFDAIMIVPTFVLMPLTYLGGVFYATSMLAPGWQIISHLNPIYYMVSAMRYSMLGKAEVGIFLSLSIIIVTVLALCFLNLYLLKKGVGLRE